MAGLTIVTPHNSIIIESQVLGRSLLRNTLLGTYQNGQNSMNFDRERGGVLQRTRKRNKRSLDIADTVYR